MAEDSTLDWLIAQHATTAPATRPATGTAVEPTTVASPLIKPQEHETVAGVLALSDGRKIQGQISSTPHKPIRIWIAEEHRYEDVAIEDVAEIRAEVLWERDQEEWHFIASGSDLKEFSGKTYPARELVYEFTLNDGTKFKGGVVAPLYVQAGAERQTFLLNKRQKGPVGDKLKDLLYVNHVTLQREK